MRQLKVIRKPIELIRENKKAFILMNAVFYGLFLLSMLVTCFFPELQVKAIDSANQQLSSPWLESTAVSAYTSGNILLASLLTFLVNLILGTILTMTGPSLVIPFIGLFMGLYRAIFWGMAFAPLEYQAMLIPHYLTLLIEGQAYVFVMLAIYLQGKSFLFPKSIGIKSCWSGYKHGFIQTAWLYVPIVVLLLVGVFTKPGN
ncbi:hypothetical protein [Paenibacillus donghaensis]|uniref:Stage II sporulation protein M n=1 Tax=Paenibacillus donghaensis TaxID=414771 RepID=A0A2Z2K8M2_9BACL|nr:hypothetical protein [Paenibacillus donghaensis]ASA21637.1 hypothetical protein B9T62_13165 [Paenibacillus donghaensis]